MRHRKSRHTPEHDKHERWMVSYADFITLLFAFFVVMYGVSSINENKYRQVSGSISRAFLQDNDQQAEVQKQSTSQHITMESLARRKVAKELQARKKLQENLQQIEQGLNNAMAPLVQNGKVEIKRTDKGVYVDINASALFDSGSAMLWADAKRILWGVADQLEQQPFRITVEGHTDDQPINTKEFSSNWDLSALRATAVVHLLRDRGIDESRLVAVGYAATRPIVANDTEENRQRNRRIALMIEMPEQGK
jgi:chemotaxis protein MotB